MFIEANQIVRHTENKRACENVCDSGCARLTGVKEYVFIALVLWAGADKELRAHSLDFFHFTLAVVVIIQNHSVQLVSGVVADGVKGDVGIRLPPYGATKKKNPKQTMTCHRALVQIKVDL